MAEGLSGRMLMEHSHAQGQSEKERVQECPEQLDKWLLSESLLDQSSCFTCQSRHDSQVQLRHHQGQVVEQ
ncbi:hypothetical protein Tco_0958584 [Tanacetum coccineum]